MCICVAVQHSTLTPSRHCCGHAKQLLTFMVRTRTKALTADDVSDDDLTYFAYIADSYRSVS